MKHLQVCILLTILAVLFSGCIRYREEWTFDRHGRGTIRITCEPSTEWKEQTQSTNWLNTVQFFIPSYHSLSQECAQSGLQILECSVHRTEPVITIVLAFDRLQQVSRCSLFSDRLLQWRWGYRRRKMTFLHKLHTHASILPAVNGSSWHPEWLSDGSVSLRFTFPGKVTEVEGAVANNNYITRDSTLTELFDGDNLLFMATARTRIPWYLIFIPVCMALLVLTVICFLFKNRIKRFIISYADSFSHSFNR